MRLVRDTKEIAQAAGLDLLIRKDSSAELGQGGP